MSNKGTPGPQKNAESNMFVPVTSQQLEQLQRGVEDMQNQKIDAIGAELDASAALALGLPAGAERDAAMDKAVHDAIVLRHAEDGTLRQREAVTTSTAGQLFSLANQITA